MKLNASLCPSRVVEEGNQPATNYTWIVWYTPRAKSPLRLPSPFIPHVPVLPSRWRDALPYLFLSYYPVDRLTWHLTTLIHHGLKWKIKRGIGRMAPSFIQDRFFDQVLSRLWVKSLKPISPKEASNFEKDLSHIAGKPVNMNFPYSDMSEMENFDLAMAKTTTFWHLSGVVP